LAASATLTGSPSLEPEEIATTLDFDHYVKESADFAVPDAMLKFEQLHEQLDTVFAAAVTPTALVRWGKKEE
jgi:uncharacterized protein (TIGR04255 family)